MCVCVCVCDKKGHHYNSELFLTVPSLRVHRAIIQNYLKGVWRPHSSLPSMWHFDPALDPLLLPVTSMEAMISHVPPVIEPVISMEPVISWNPPLGNLQLAEWVYPGVLLLHKCSSVSINVQALMSKRLCFHGGRYIAEPK